MTALFPAGDPEVLYIVDLSSYLLRAYHAIGELKTVSGEPTNATYGTVTMLERLVRERRPQFMTIAMDSGRETFRRDIYANYKATRPPPPDDLQIQMRRANEIVDAFAIPVLRQQGVEADDLIATAVRRAHEQKLKTVILGADKDLMQLVSSDVIMWDTMRDRVFGVPEVEERYGVKVSQLRDLLALMGDSSDNIPGVPHVGPKTGRDLLLEFGTLENVYASLDSITKKSLRENLAAHREQAFLSQQLVTLKDDCPIDFDIEKLRWGGRDVDRLRQLYAELEFTRQLNNLDTEVVQMAPSVKRPSAPPPEKALEETRTETVLDRPALEALAARIRETKKVALEVETLHPTLPTSDIVGLAFCPEPARAWYVPLAHRGLGAPGQLDRGTLESVLGPLLGDPEIAKVAHSLKREQVALESHGLSLAGGRLDAELESYLLDPDARHGLPEIAERELGLTLPNVESLTRPGRGRGIDFDQVAIEDAARWAGTRVEAALRAGERLRTRVDDEGLSRILDDIELPLSGLLAEMEQSGVLVDTSRLAELGKVCEAELTRLEQQAYSIAGRPFNLSSPRQLESLLFDELGLKPIKRTKTSRSTDAETLEALEEHHPLPRVILEHRQVAKLKGTYIDALPLLVNKKTGRIHTSWAQAVAATGRLSSVDPNLQNIPIRSELGMKIREAFVAPPGFSLVSGDYSQIELRVLAHLSKDPVLLEAFRTGQDIHTRTAMEIFEVSPDEITPEHRRRAKAVNFGVIYGQGESGLAKSLGIPRAEAASFIAKYFRRYQGVRRFMNETLDGARASESVRTLLGRRRLIPDIRSGNRARRLAAERIAMNAPIQGTAADILKLAMLRFKTPPVPGSRLVLTVHDELVFEVPSEKVQEAIPIIRSAMESTFALEVPLVVGVGHGPTWVQAH
jgi:DNA polymerase-1